MGKQVRFSVEARSAASPPPVPATARAANGCWRSVAAWALARRGP